MSGVPRDNWIAEVVHHLKRLGCSDDAWNGVARLLVTHELGGNDDGNRFIRGIVDHDRPFTHAGSIALSGLLRTSSGSSGSTPASRRVIAPRPPA